MLKNIYKKISLLIFWLIWFFISNQTHAFKWSDLFDFSIRWWTGWGWTDNAPKIWCDGLPWCRSSGNWSPTTFLVSLIDTTIQIVAVLSVFALVISWIMYMISAWDEEKANRAKRWIVWSLVWVFLSGSAWWIIILLNNSNFR